MWPAIRSGLLRVGHVLGTINNFILLTLIYLLFFPWLRIWWVLSRHDPMGHRNIKRPVDASAWTEPDTPPAPTLEDMEHLF